MIVCLASPTHATVFHCSTLAKWSMVTSSAMVPVSLQISAPLSLPFYLSLNSVELSKANWYIRSSELRLCHENADVVPRQEDKNELGSSSHSTPALWARGYERFAPAVSKGRESRGQ